MNRLGSKLRQSLMFRSDLHQYQVNVWGVIAAFSKFALLLPEAVKPVRPRELDRGTKRRRCLHKNFAGDLSSSGAASDLSKQLESAFTGSKVGQMQADICIDDAHQGDIRKIEALGDHLCTDENVDLSTPKSAKGLSISVFSYHRIRIHPSQPSFWEKLLDNAFDLFGTETGVTNSRIRTFGTFPRSQSNMTTYMALQPLLR